MKRFFVIILSLILLLTTFGCSSEEDAIVLTVKQSNESDGDFILQQKVLNEYIAAFNKKYPDVEVKIQYVYDLPGSFEDTDVILMSADEVLEFAPTDLKIISEECKDSISKMLKPAANIGKLQIETQSYETYFLPFNYDRAVVYADKELFDKFDVSVPSADWTYDDFVKISKQLSGEDKESDLRYFGTHLPLSKTYVWKYHVEQLGDGWYDENGIVNFESDINNDVFKEIINLYKGRTAKCYSFSNSASNREGPVAMAWINAFQPENDDYRILSEKSEESLVGRRIDKVAEKGNLILLPLPRADEKESYSYSNTDFIDGFAISKYISEDKLDGALKLIEFAQTLEGNSILNSYYSGIPANNDLVSKDFWRTGYFTGDNAENLLIGIENDRRDDYAEILEDDFNIFEKNLRMRSVASENFNVEFKKSAKNVNALETTFKNMASIFNSTILESGAAYGYIDDAVNQRG